MYRFTDNGGRDVALRFDLTVPIARFLAEHRSELSMPFKRYHIAKVWRGENTQRGRYREFTQCDFDIIGSDSPASDFEIMLVMRNTLGAIQAGELTIHLNHRGLFNRFLARLELLDKSVDILRTVDKLAKIGREETLKLLTESVGADNAGKILGFIEATGSYEEILNTITQAATVPAPNRNGSPSCAALCVIRARRIPSSLTLPLPGGLITIPAWSTRPSSMICPASARCVPGAGMTT
ncbi:hypothetical protein FACS1894142_8400 [Spirochaetia bacterium]|nr:hypothetical protein FACS1894142_8400 [Spirochaetia bacterium]